MTNESSMSTAHMSTISYEDVRKTAARLKNLAIRDDDSVTIEDVQKAVIETVNFVRMAGQPPTDLSICGMEVMQSPLAVEHYKETSLYCRGGKRRRWSVEVKHKTRPGCLIMAVPALSVDVTTLADSARRSVIEQSKRVVVLHPSIYRLLTGA